MLASLLQGFNQLRFHLLEFLSELLGLLALRLLHLLSNPVD
jgi:hypothetical protein